MADVLQDDERAVELHQAFKWKVVGNLPHAQWQLTDEEIRTIVRELSVRE